VSNLLIGGRRCERNDAKQNKKIISARVIVWELMAVTVTKQFEEGTVTQSAHDFPHTGSRGLSYCRHCSSFSELRRGAAPAAGGSIL
jgi:hypothetical protein